MLWYDVIGDEDFREAFWYTGWSDEVCDALYKWYRDYEDANGQEAVLFLGKIQDAWDLYDEDEIRDMWMFVDGETLDEMLWSICGCENYIIEVDGKYLIASEFEADRSFVLI